MSRSGPPPPANTRFPKGKSGNPKGRPKAPSRPSASAFDILTERSLTVTQNGKQRELTVEEALQYRTYQAAIKGSRLAQRQVLKMIAKREKWLAARRTRHRNPVEVLTEREDLHNADEALLLLGVAELNEREPSRLEEPPSLLFRTWAVQQALSRGRRPLSAHDVEEIKLCTRDAETLRWPARARHEQSE